MQEENPKYSTPFDSITLSNEDDKSLKKYRALANGILWIIASTPKRD